MATEPLVYLSRFSPETESATLSAMRGWQRDEAEEIVREEGGTPYVLLSDYDALRARVAELEAALSLAVDAMRAPLDGWKGEVERQALDVARATLRAGVGLSGNKPGTPK